VLSEQLDQPVAKREKCRFEDSECKLHRPSDPRGADAHVPHGLHDAPGSARDAAFSDG